MLFNSLEFAIFLPIVFLLYWFVSAKDLRIQNILLLIASGSLCMVGLEVFIFAVEPYDT